MMNRTKSNWIDDYGPELNIAKLREMFSPATRFRVSESNYAAGITFGGSMIAGKCFVFSGSVTYRFNECEFNLSAGEWAQFPAGTFEVSTGEKSAVSLVMVWEIPRNQNA